MAKGKQTRTEDVPEPPQAPPSDGTTRVRDPETFMFVSKLTPEVEAEIVKALRAGAPPETACAFAGVVRSTYYDWLRQGRAAIAQANGNAPQIIAEDPFAHFAAAVDWALAQFVVGNMTQIGLHGRANRDGDWKALSWQLEHRFPALFHKHTRHSVSGSVKVEHAIVLDPGKLDTLPMERKLLLAEILAELDGEVIDADPVLELTE